MRPCAALRPQGASQRPRRSVPRAPVAAVLLVLAATGAHTRDDAPLLTLREVVLAALAGNDRVLTSRESVEQARLGRTVADAAFATRITPNLLGSLGQSDVRNQTYGVAASRRFPTGTEVRMDVGASTFRNQIGSFYAADTTLLVSQSLLRGFGPAVGRRQIERADYLIAGAERQHFLTEQQLAIDVAGAYYRLIAQQELAVAARATVDNARGLLAASQAKLRANLVSQLDVFRARQLVADAEGQLFDVESTVEDLKDQLRFLMARDGDYEFRVAAEMDGRVAPISPAAAVELALENRSELREAEAAVKEAEREVRFARHQLLPQLDVSLALTRRETADVLRDAFGLDRFEPVTFFSASTPLDRTAEAARVQTAAIERNRRARARDTLRRRIAEEARRAVRLQQRLENRLRSAEVSVEFAEREVELAALRFQRGLSNNLDVVNAQAGLLNATNRRLAVLADLAVARLALLATVGTLDVRRDVW